ncbi:MAG: TlpA family protein disulfide reductase, partial [Pseudomonadota bacterium]
MSLISAPRTAAKIAAASLFYLAALAGANPVFAEGLKPALDPLREGDMRKLVVHAEPRDLRDAAFTDPDGAELDLTDDLGKVLLVNF